MTHLVVPIRKRADPKDEQRTKKKIRRVEGKKREDSWRTVHLFGVIGYHDLAERSKSPS